MKIIEFENKEVDGKVLYAQLKSLIIDLQKKEIGCRVKTSINREMIKNIFIMLENDGMLVDYDNKVIIWDKEKAQYYKNMLSAVCERRCAKAEKGLCMGCAEYAALSPLISHFVTEEVILSIA